MIMCFQQDRKSQNTDSSVDPRLTILSKTQARKIANTVAMGVPAFALLGIETE